MKPRLRRGGRKRHASISEILPSQGALRSTRFEPALSATVSIAEWAGETWLWVCVCVCVCVFFPVYQCVFRCLRLQCAGAVCLHTSGP